MQTSQEELRAQVLHSQDVRLLEEQSWMLPAVKLTVTFETITKTTMDILMKMTLLALERLPMERESDIAQLLGVETLFVSDLLKMLEADGLVVFRKQWRITEKGESQLKEGQYIHAAEQEEALLLYTPLLDVFLTEFETDTAEAQANNFRYTWNDKEWSPRQIPTDRVEAELAKTAELENTDYRMQTVGRVLDITQSGLTAVPCYEFRLYDKRTDSLYVRVWNTASDQWDETLEEYILSRERSDWRKRYLEEGE